MTSLATTEEQIVWTSVCAVSDIDPECGVTALVGDRAVAVFRTFDDRVFALDNHDPFSNASVLSRGLVGTLTREDETIDVVASPMYKQRFCLATGRCLEDDTVAVPTYDVQVIDGVIQVSSTPSSLGAEETG